MDKKTIAQNRKTQIIETALKLFAEKGYDNTSVDCIIRASSLSKGGFYHHFSSKEMLLEEIAQMFISDIMQIAYSIDQQTHLSALEKLNSFFLKVNQLKKERPVEVILFMQELYEGDKNIRLERIVFQYSQHMLLPFVRGIVKQGIDEKTFRTDYPEEAADFFTKLFLIHQQEMGALFMKALSDHGPDRFDIILRRYSFLQNTLENMLGIKQGDLEISHIARDILDDIGRRFTELPSKRSPDR